MYFSATLLLCILWGEWVCPLTVDLKTPLYDTLWWNGIKVQTQSQDDGVKAKSFECCEGYIYFFQGKRKCG